MAELIEVFGFDNDGIRGFEKYKGKKGETHRTGIIFTDPKSIFAGKKIHFKQRYFICKNSICCEKLGPPKWRIAVAIVKYNTDKIGNIVQPFGYEILPWVFGEGTYVKLKTTNSEFSLLTHDIKISCTNDDFQHLDITPCNESIWQSKDTLKKKILDEAKIVWEYAKKDIAQDLSVEEIKDLIGLSSVGDDPSSKVNLESVLDNV